MSAGEKLTRRISISIGNNFVYLGTLRNKWNIGISSYGRDVRAGGGVFGRFLRENVSAYPIV